MNYHSTPRVKPDLTKPLEYELANMTYPVVVLPWMILFLVLVAGLVVALFNQLHAAFLNNPGFNTLILALLLFGVFINLRQVLLLQREVNWIERFRHGKAPSSRIGKPKLLASMARLLTGREKEKQKLSPLALRSILDSLASRLDESRDLSRYLTGVLIFLGLLGTFYGLLLTIRSVSDIIGSLTAGGDASTMFETLKGHLKSPLSGMGTSFSTSLFGLAGSLILGFLDLQTGHAQNRFYNETEEWLSGMTHLSETLALGEGGEGGRLPAYLGALLEQTADNLDRMQRTIADSEREQHASAHALQQLNTQLARLNENLSRESRQIQMLTDAQLESQSILASLAQKEVPISHLTDELRQELRLLSRTIAGVLEQKVRR